jgi:hypothetical protein
MPQFCDFFNATIVETKEIGDVTLWLDARKNFLKKMIFERFVQRLGVEWPEW